MNYLVVAAVMVFCIAFSFFLGYYIGKRSS